MESILLSAQQIKAEAKRLGFSACGLSVAQPLKGAAAENFLNWLAEGKNAGMAYLDNHSDKRLNPQLLVEGAKTVVSVALNYYTEEETPVEGYTLARYARGRDYHDVMREKLRLLMASLGLTEHKDGRIFCDTAPVAERYWAVQGGLGWCGRNGQLIIPHAGSWFFLGELILIHPADAYDTTQEVRCGTCRRCVEACPTGALSGDGTLDARRCLSYLTIEHRGEIPDETAKKMGSCIYGCDRCSEVCPWNSFSSPTEVADFQPKEILRKMTQSDWESLSVEQYRALFKGSAVKRAKYEGLVRNIRAVADEF